MQIESSYVMEERSTTKIDIHFFQRTDFSQNHIICVPLHQYKRFKLCGLC